MIIFGTNRAFGCPVLSCCPRTFIGIVAKLVESVDFEFFTFITLSPDLTLFHTKDTFKQSQGVKQTFELVKAPCESRLQ